MKRHTFYAAIVSLFFSAIACAEPSLVSFESRYSAKETADRFETMIKEKGFTVFGRVDHQKNAAGVDLTLNPTEVIIFGNPKVGTRLMQCSQKVAIDLPQKVLVHKDSEQKVWLSYNNPNYLMKRHNIQGCDEIIRKVSAVLGQLATAATAK